MKLLIFCGWMAGAVVGMELLSYVLHRWIFHGPLWILHASHHRKRTGALERNDAFGVFFAAASIALMLWGLSDPLASVSFPIGLGMTVYGMLYFSVHDMLTHKRFYPWSTQSAWLESVRRAHLRHHQAVGKVGAEPFGLFLFRRGPDGRRDGDHDAASTMDPSAPIEASGERRQSI